MARFEGQIHLNTARYLLYLFAAQCCHTFFARCRTEDKELLKRSKLVFFFIG